VNTTPKVSIVIPVYNGSNYLREAIDSALAQTYQNIEIVVVNDGSNDSGATEQIALSYGDKVRYFYKENGGVASALNRAIEEMTGEYFSWLSHDDLYYPNKVAAQIQALYGMDRTTTILYSDHAMFFDDDVEAVKEMSLPATPPEQFRYFITVNNSLNGCTLLVPAAAFVECGTFDEKLRTTQDYDLWFKLAKKFKFVHLPEVLVKSRQHFGQGSAHMKSIALIECNALLAGFVSKLSEAEITSATHKSVSRSYVSISANLCLRGFNKAGRHAADMAMKNLHRDSLVDAIKSVMLLLLANLAAALPARLRTLLASLLLRIKMLGVIKKWFFPKQDASLSMNLKERFSQIYSKNIFGGEESRSGEGSNMVQTAEIRRELSKLLREFEIKTFMDAPCGDWHWMKELPLGVDQYIGVDIVDSLIESNRQQFGNAATSFVCLNLASDQLPQADLIFCRDCLVHLTFEDIRRVIANFKQSNSKYLLTTTFTDRLGNFDLEGSAIWRPLNLEVAPFNFPKPVKLINEKCTEANNQFTDKCLGLWLLDDIKIS
jgi:glycosyltransferase involved in cell wall biosynthesis